MHGGYEVVLWKLLPEGSCGVGDHSRGLVRNLGGRIIDLSAGMTPTRTHQIVQYVPSGWTDTVTWAGALCETLQRHPATERTLFLHEVRRRWAPRAIGAWFHDVFALRLLLPLVDRVIVTTHHRQEEVRAMMRRWGIRVPVHVLAVASNVHPSDPLPDDIGTAWRGQREVVLFARSGGGVLAEPLADAVARLLSEPDVRVTLLGKRPADQDGLLSALKSRSLVERVEVTGFLAAEQVAERLARASVGLSLHDTGVSGRRGTVSAMLASGLPVVTSRGIETGPSFESQDGVLLVTESTVPDPVALADAALGILDEVVAPARRRRCAARALYLQSGSWSSLEKALRAGRESHEERPVLRKAS